MVNRRSVESRLVPAVAGFVQPRVKEEVDSTSRFQVHLEAKMAKFYLNDGTSNVPQTYLESEQNYTVRLGRIRRAGRPRKHSSRYDSTFKVTFGLDFVNPQQHSRKATLFANWIHENGSTQLFTVNPPLADCFTEPNFSRTHQIWSSLWNTNHSGGAGATAELYFEFNFLSKDFKLPDSSTQLISPLKLVFECYKYDSATHDWTERIERKCCVIKVFSKYGATRRHCVDGYLTALDDSTGSQYALLPESLPKDVTKFWSFADEDQNAEEDQSEPVENEQMEIRVDEPIEANVAEDDDDDRTIIDEEEDQIVPQNDHAREEEQQQVPMEIEGNDGNSVFDNENGVGIEDYDGQEANWLNTSASRESRPYQEMSEPTVPQAAVSPPLVSLPPSTSTLNNPPLNNQPEEQQVKSPNRSQEFFLAINEFETQSRTSIDQMPTDQPNTSNHIQIINQTRIQPAASNLNQIANQSSPNQQQYQHVESPNIILPEGAVMLPISSNQYHSEESSQAINELDLAAIQSRASDQIPDVHPGTSNQFQIINQTLSNQYHHQQQQQVESPNRFPESLPAINEFDVSPIQSRTSDDQIPDVQPAASYQNQIINQTWSNHQQQQQVESPNVILPERAVMYPITSNQYYSEDSSPTYNGFNPSTLQPGTYGDQMSTDQPSTSKHIQIINQTLSNQYHHHQQQQQVESPTVILSERSVTNQITLTPLHYSEELFQPINEMDLLAIQSPTSDHILTVQPGASNQNQITNQTSLSNQQQHQHVELPNVILPEHSEMLPITSTPFRYDHSEESSQAINELDISVIQPRASVNQMSPVQSGTESDQNQIVNQTLSNQPHQQQVDSPNVIQSERAVFTMYPITSAPYHSEESSPNAINEMNLLAIQPRVSDQMADVQPGTSNLNQISNQTLANPYLDPQFSYNRVSQEVVRNVVIKKEPIEGQKTLPLTSRDQQVRRQQFVRIIVRKIIKDEPSEEQAVPPPPPPTVNQIEPQPNDQVKVIYLTIPETLHAYPVYIYDPDDFMAAFQLALAPAFGEFTPREVRLVGQLDDGQIDTMSVNPQLLSLIANESIFDVNVSTDGVVFMAFKTDVEQPRNAQQV